MGLVRHANTIKKCSPTSGAFSGKQSHTRKPLPAGEAKGWDSGSVRVPHCQYRLLVARWADPIAALFVSVKKTSVKASSSTFTTSPPGPKATEVGPAKAIMPCISSGRDVDPMKYSDPMKYRVKTRSRLSSGVTDTTASRLVNVQEQTLDTGNCE